MNRTTLALITFLIFSPAQLSAEPKRQLDAHAHGRGALNIAIEGKKLSIELEVPGSDIVGFEHAARSEKDRTSVKNAKKKLAKPLGLFTLPDQAQCSLQTAKVTLVGDADEEHGHKEDAHGHKEDKHGHKEDKHGHKEHEHSKAEEETSHSEFHAEYALLCSNPAAITKIDFPYFKTFPGAETLEVKMITDKGQKAFDVSRDLAVIDVRGML